MIWLWVGIGIFVLIATAMYVPDWIRWAKWNAKRKRLPPSKAKKLRPPVAAPFWSGYVGHGPVGGPSSGAECAPSGIDGTAGAGGSGGDDGGGCD